MYSTDYFKNPVTVNRPLAAAEQACQLEQKTASTTLNDDVAHYALSVIALNSTYVEIVDRNYPFRGIASLMGLIAVSMAFFVLSFTLFGKNVDLVDVAMSCLLPVPFLLAALWIFLKESFAYTHYPVRLNRKNRMIYVWRKTGVLAVSWDKVFFFLREYKDAGLTMWDVRGNVLANDGKTVIDSFPLSSYQSSDKDQVHQHFEYFRLYMEDGPRRPWRTLLGCLPIAKRH